MSIEHENFMNAVQRIVEAVMFENWIRFYFIAEMKKDEDDNSHLFIIIPEKGMHNIKTLYPELYPLAEDVNNKEISFEISQQVVCTYVVENIDGTIIPRDTAPSIMDSLAFRVQLELFNTWLQLHDDQLEQSFMDFGTWKKLYTEWKESSAGKQLTEKLMLSMQKPLAEANE